MVTEVPLGKNNMHCCNRFPYMKWSAEIKSWVFSGFLPQRKLTGWVRINTVKKNITISLG